MAGDWIKMRVDLADDPAVIGVAAALGVEEDLVVGKLHRFWSWADQQTVDGDAPGVTVAWLDKYLCAQGFADALSAVGWLVVEADGIQIPYFDRHNGQPGKQRALTSKRMAKSRSRKRDALSVTKTSPDKREEKSIEATNVASSPVAPEPHKPQLTFPLSGGKLWDLPARKLDEYRATHGDRFDVESELRKARQWLMDNNDRRPRASKGMGSFLTRWLNRTSDKARPTMLGSTVAAKPGDDAVYNPETGELVTPMEKKP